MVSSKQVPLSEAFWFQEGPGVRNWQFTTSGVKLLNVGNITKDGNIDLDKTDKHISLDEAEGKYSHFLIDEGDLVIASSGISFDEDSMLRTRGAFIEKKHLPLCLNTSTIRFKAIEDVSDLNFFKFWLDSFEFRDQVSRLVTGSAQQNFGPSHLKAINISLPPLTEQKRVASLLARADRLRQLRRTAHDLSDSVLQSVFLEMFGEYLKPSNPFTLMEELVKITGGGTPSRDVPEYFEGNIPWLTSKDMRGDYIYDTQEHITEKAIKESATNLVPVGSILLVVKSKILMRRLPVAITKVPLCHGQDIKSIQCSNKVNPHFLVAVLKYNEANILFQARGANTEGLTLPMLHEIKVPNVPLSLQEEFAGVVRRVESLRGKMRESERQVEGLFESLLSESFGGVQL